MKIYLAGPMANCKDEEMFQWREEVKLKLNKHQKPSRYCCQVYEPEAFHFLDPTRRDYRLAIFDIETSKKVVERDKADIGLSDIILVNHTRISVGTSMEIMFGAMLGKRIIVIENDETHRFEKLSPWIVYHATDIVKSIDEAVALIISIDRDIYGY